jgi:transposase
MAYREVSVIEVREVLRAWLSGAGLRTVAGQAGVDRKTARRYVQAAEAAGVVRDGGLGQLSDEVLGAVVAAVRPARPAGHGSAWELLQARRDELTVLVDKGLTVTKIGELLARRGVVVPYRTLHRFCVQCCGFGRRTETVRVADGEPGAECQVDFGKLGLLHDSGEGRRRVTHALIFTAVYSGHMFVWLTFAQTLEAVIAGCEAAWAFFGGCFRVLVPDNMSAVVAEADAVNPRFTVGWLDYAQHCGLATDPARVRHAKDKPRVERTVQYVRSSFWAGEVIDLTDAQTRVGLWCLDRAGQRVHGTTQARPAQTFAEHEAGLLLPVPSPYDMPVFKTVKVHRDFRRGRQGALQRAEGLHRTVPRRAGRLGIGQAVPPRPVGQGASAATPRRQMDRPGRPASGQGRLRDAGPGPARRRPPADTATASVSMPNGCSTTRCPGRGCGRSTGCSGWPAATATLPWTPPAARPWTSTSST